MQDGVYICAKIAAHHLHGNVHGAPLESLLGIVAKPRDFKGLETFCRVNVERSFYSVLEIGDHDFLNVSVDCGSTLFQIPLVL